jgi:hypothetical protein
MNNKMKENKNLIEIEATLKNFSSLPLRSLGDNKNNLNSNPPLRLSPSSEGRILDKANYIMPGPGYAGTSKKDCYFSPSGRLGMVDMMIPTIFKKNVKNNSKLRPLNEIISDVGEIQYFPA